MCSSQEFHHHDHDGECAMSNKCVQVKVVVVVMMIMITAGARTMMGMRESKHISAWWRFIRARSGRLHLEH
jgi:hypothetical protein